MNSNNFNVKEFVIGAIWTILGLAAVYALVAILLTFDASDGTYPGGIYHWLKMDQFAHWFFGLFFGQA